MINSLIKKTKFLIPIVITIGCYPAYCQCPNSTSSNLITNGNFESCVVGNQVNDGFTTGYTYIGGTTCPGGGGTMSIGEWTVDTSAHQVETGYYSNPTGNPGSSPAGKYLIVDVDSDTTKPTYITTVNVVAGTTYFFSAWMADVNTTFNNPPVLQFTINSSQVGHLVYVDSLKNSNAWQQFFVTWKAPANVNGAITIEIKNRIPASGGNDLALDNISFSTGCSTITNLNGLGKTASIMDTLYECDFNFPYTITSGLPSSGYGFIWENSSLTALSGTNNQASYTFTTAPAPGKYYLCYDTIPGCYRTDSFIVSKELSVSLGANQTLCPPIAETLTPTPNLTASGLTYSWKYNSTTIAGATSNTYQATQTGTYAVTVTSSSPSCGSVTSQMTITSPSSPLTGTVSCASGTYQFSATSGTYNTINGASNVAWYNVPSNGTAFTANPNSISARVSTGNMAISPGCSIGGLYAQDLYSFNGTLGPTSQPCASVSTMGNNAGYMMLTVYANVTINSMQIVQQNYSTGGTASYAAQILSNSPGSGPYSGSCNCNTDGPGAVIATATGPSYTFPQVSSSNPTIRTLNFGPSGAGYTLSGTPTGTKYWIGISGSEFGYLSCGATYPYENVPANVSVIELTEQLIYGNVSSQMMGFNIQLTEGSPNPCSRSWVCASTGCVTPVKFLYINVEAVEGATTINWATASEENNHFFIVQKSSNSINFTNIDTIVGAGNSNSILDYSYTDKESNSGVTYYRIEQVDYNGDYTYSEIVSITSPNTTLIRVYPIPVKSGNNLIIDFASDKKQVITLTVTDIVGKGLAHYLKNVETGANGFTIPTEQLAPATYILEVVTQNGERTVQRVIVD